MWQLSYHTFISVQVFPAKLFQDTLVFAKEAGAKFNGVLCGRATWAGVVPVYIKQGQKAAREWLQTVGREKYRKSRQSTH